MATIGDLLSFASSRSVRSTIGERKVELAATQGQLNKDGNFFGIVWSFISNAAIALFEWVTSWKLSDIWGWVCQSIGFLMNFNWNPTDISTQTKIKASFARCAGYIGSTIGDAFGRIACGALPTAALVVLAPEIGEAVAGNITKELLDGFLKNLLISIRGCADALASAGLAWTYGNIRRAIIGSDDDFKKKLQAQGIPANQIAERMAQRSKPFTFNGWITENLIETDHNEITKAIKQQAYQQFGQSCTEAGYVFCEHIEEFIHQQNMFSGGNYQYAQVEYDASGNPVVSEVSFTGTTPTVKSAASPSH